MTEVQALATFAERARFADLSEAARKQLKIRVLDTVGVAIGALDAPPIVAIYKLTIELGGELLSTLIGGAKTAPDLERLSIMARSAAISISWTAISPRAKPVTHRMHRAVFLRLFTRRRVRRRRRRSAPSHKPS